MKYLYNFMYTVYIYKLVYIVSFFRIYQLTHLGKVAKAAAYCKYI